MTQTRLEEGDNPFFYKTPKRMSCPTCDEMLQYGTCGTWWYKPKKRPQGWNYVPSQTTYGNTAVRLLSVFHISFHANILKKKKKRVEGKEDL